MRSVNTFVVGILLAAGSSSLLAQANPAGGSNVAPSAVKASQHAPKTAAKPKAKVAARKPVEAAAPAADAQTSSDVDKSARRDPFESLVNRNKDNNAGKNLPPGKAGLQVSTLRLDGIVKSSNGMIAVVSNPQARTYFLREGDQLYDGRVEKIAMDGVSFHELGKDAFGKPVERQVNKRIYASAGEQQ
jgi:Tfp pilus assembly protein PilP